MRIWKTIVGTTIFFLLSLPVLADSRFEQFEEMSERLSEKMNSFFLAQAPSLKGKLPSSEWDADFRKAGRCLFDRYNESYGTQFVDQMISKSNKLINQEFESIEAFSEAALAITSTQVDDATSIKINQECGMAELQMKRMQESGFVKALMEAGL